MELITAFTSAVGLLGMFKNEVRDRKGQDYDFYIDWLRRQEHRQLVDQILDNKDLSRSLRILVEDQHDQVMEKLAELDKVLSSVASRIDGFTQLANAVRVGSGLSDQAVSILRQMNAAGASDFIEHKHPDRNKYLFRRTVKPLQIDDPRFIEDDLLTLVDLGLLRLDYNEHGNRFFSITRAGATVGG